MIPQDTDAGTVYNFFRGRLVIDWALRSRWGSLSRLEEEEEAVASFLVEIFQPVAQAAWRWAMEGCKLETTPWPSTCASR